MDHLPWGFSPPCCWFYGARWAGNTWPSGNFSLAGRIRTQRSRAIASFPLLDKTTDTEVCPARPSSETEQKKTATDDSCEGATGCATLTRRIDSN